MSLCCDSFSYEDDWHLFIQVLSDCDYEYFIKSSILLACMNFYFIQINLDFLIIIDININLKLNYSFVLGLSN